MEIANINDITPEDIEQYSEEKKVEPDNLMLSLKYILDFYYGDIKLETIQSFAPKMEDNKFSVESVLSVANEVQLNAVYKEIKASDIASYFLPCIIFDKNDEPLVLIAKNMKEATILNVKDNSTFKIDNSKLKKYKKTVLFFRDKESEKLIDIEKTKDWFWNPVKSFWKQYIEIGILTFFINIFALFIPLFTMSVYDRVIPNGALETLYVLAGGISIVLLFDWVFKNARSYIIEKVGKKLGLLFEESLLKIIFNVKDSFDVYQTGMKMNLFRELATVKDFFATRTILQIIDIPFFFLALSVMYMISPTIALVVFLVAFVLLLVNFLLQYPISNLSKKQISNMSSKHNYLVESIHGKEIIKLTNATPTKLFSWKNLVAFTDHIALKIQSLNIISLNTSQTILQMNTVLVIIVGVHEIIDKQLSMGGLIAMSILSTRALVPIVQLSQVVVKFREIKESLDHLNDFWHLPQEGDEKIAIGLGNLKGSIEFKDVTFYYPKSKYPSLHKCSFKINAGEKVGIIGQTGAGKSTILRLVSGFESPTKGSLFLDGHDISTIHPVELRQNISIMPQNPYIFSGTLKENIELTRAVSKNRVMELIELTGLSELVKKSGQGDGMQVGENGSNLSEGQKHLISLSRALVSDPSILILDEPTTGLDIGLEKSVVDKLKHITSNKTVLVITHRFAALELVDRVIVLTDGRVVADGPRDEILNKLRGK